MSAGVDLWSAFEPVITPLLWDDDDPELWRAVVNGVYSDAQVLCRLVPRGWSIVTQLGRCSHWLRPHQTRWTADGGFAWPSGYDGPRWSRSGLPEFDWSQQWSWRPQTAGWEVHDAPQSRQIVFRVAVPSRSRRHLQAAVHTVWQPSTPLGWKVDVTQFYGFRQQASGDWSCTAYCACPWRAEGLYERAAKKGTAEPRAAPDPAT